MKEDKKKVKCSRENNEWCCDGDLALRFVTVFNQLFRASNNACTTIKNGLQSHRRNKYLTSSILFRIS